MKENEVISEIEQRMKDPSYCVGALEDISYLISELRDSLAQLDKAHDVLKKIQPLLWEEGTQYDDEKSYVAAQIKEALEEE